METKDMEAQAWARKDVKVLVDYYFDFELTKGQIDIVRTIAFTEHRRISINAYTRYGKTRCVAFGVCLYIMSQENKKIAIIAPQKDQTEILRNYIAECIIACPKLNAITELAMTRDVQSLRREASKTRQTFSNGCEYRVFTAYGEAKGLMGFGADLIVKDEAALIGNDANIKITRMLGDDPENSIMVELSNPWDPTTLACEHFRNPSWKSIHIGWQQGVKEGRTTNKFIEEMREELRHDPIAFTVLYESNYPEESEDALFKYMWIRRAIENKMMLTGAEVVYGLDVAEMGRDITVLTKVLTQNGLYIVDNPQVIPKGDTENTADEVAQRINRSDSIKVDAVGVGKGVYDKLVKRSYNVKEIKGGRTPTENEHAFQNQNAQFYWKLRVIFEEGRIVLPNHPQLILELLSLKFERTTGQKIKIIKPKDKSPDYADSLMYAIAEPDKEWMFELAEM